MDQYIKDHIDIYVKKVLDEYAQGVKEDPENHPVLGLNEYVELVWGRAYREMKESVCANMCMREGLGAVEHRVVSCLEDSNLVCLTEFGITFYATVSFKCADGAENEYINEHWAELVEKARERVEFWEHEVFVI